LLGGLVAMLFSLIPLFFIVESTISTGWTESMHLLLRSRVAELLGNTAALLAVAVPLTTLIAVSCAWLVERATLPFRKLWHTLLVAPLAIPAFITAYGWSSVVPSMQGFGGAVLIVSLSYYPVIYLPVAASLRGLDPALEESARATGARPISVFLRVTLPQLRPALFGGILLVSLHLLSEFGAFSMLQFQTFTTAIYEQYQSAFNPGAANMLASVLIFACLAFLCLEISVRGHGRLSRVGSGTARPATRVRLRGGIPFALGWVVAVATCAIGVPIYSIGYWLVTGNSTEFPVADLTSTTLSTLQWAALASIGTLIVAFPIAWLSVRYRSTFVVLIERSTYIGTSVPGLVVALALVTFALRFAQPIYQTSTLLILAYVILFLPKVIVSIRSGLTQIPVRYTELAQSLGNRPIIAFIRVTMPLLRASIGSGMALVFLATMNELTATLLLAPTGTQTLATQFWAASDEMAYGQAAPFAALMVLFSLPASYLLARQKS
jgi:iron(III) transport system permease protein